MYESRILDYKNPQKRTSYFPRGEYRAAQRGNSWKAVLMQNINQAMKKSGTRKDFVQEMKRRGYDMIWTDARKSITFICPNGMKCRDFKLHEQKYLKENLENEFKLREQLSEQPHIEKTVSQKTVKDDRWIIFGDERKKEQEAKMAGGNLGALIGIGTGIISALIQKDEPDEELIREQEEIDEMLEDEIEDDEYIDFMMGM